MMSMRRLFRGQTGSLLVITLWLISILSVLAVAIARYLSLEVRLTKYRVAREQAKVLARSGVYLAMQRLAHDAQRPPEQQVDWLQDDWAFDAAHPWVIARQPTGQQAASAGDRVEITIADEERRFDLNSHDANVLSRLTVLLNNADAAGAIVEYPHPPLPQPQDQPEIPYYPKHGPIQTLDEVLDIPKVQDVARTTPAVMTTEFEEGTVYTAGRVNVNTASAAVLHALKDAEDPGMPALIEQFVQKRSVGPDHQPGTLDDCLLTSDANSNQWIANCLGTGRPIVDKLVSGLGRESAVFRIVATGIVTHPAVQYRVEAIVQRAASGEVPTVLAWREG